MFWEVFVVEILTELLTSLENYEISLLKVISQLAA